MVSTNEGKSEEKFKGYLSVTASIKKYEYAITANRRKETRELTVKLLTTWKNRSNVESLLDQR